MALQAAKKALLLAFAGIAAGQDEQIYAPSQQLSVNDCPCTSPCQTKLLVDCNSGEVCKVSNDCKGAQFSVAMLSYIDYCKFPAYTKYEDLSAKEKMKILMGRIHKDTQADKYPSAASIFGGLMQESVRISFDVVSDIFPEDRTKYIHSVGAVAPIVWKALPGVSYGGLFASGVSYGLIRFSSANEPGKSGFTPGVGVKLLRDGKPSANFVAMPSLDGQKCEETNFFAKTFSNHVPTTSSFLLGIVAKKFWQASYCPQTVGLSHMADGSSNFPFQIQLVPSNVNVECPCLDYAQCLANLQSELTPGKALFDVYALATPQSSPEKIAEITIGDAAPVSSKFGDEQLFFKHQYMEDDFKLHPEWLEQIDKKTVCGMAAVSTEVPPASHGCHAPIGAMRDDDVIVA